MYSSFAFERTVHFLSDKLTELYIEYNDGVAQLKNVVRAKSILQSRALLGLERCGA